MYLDVSSRLGDVREDSSLFCTLHSNTRCKETFNATPSFHQNGFGILIICQPAGLPLGNLTCSRSSQTQNSMSSSRLASGGCLFCVIATGQRELGLICGCELENYGESSVARIFLDIEPFEGKLRIAFSFGLMRSGQVRRIRSRPFSFTVDVLFVCLLLEAIMKRGSLHFESRRF